MMKNKNLKLLAAVGVQVIILISIIVFKLLILGTGTEVVLKIRPVDPTSPLRGDYVTFEYDISTIGKHQFDTDQFIAPNTTVYVNLRQRRDYWIVDSASLSRPADGVFIKGKVTGNNDAQLFRQIANALRNTQTTVNVEYGIEQYFIPEGVGRDFRFIGRDAAAIVKVDNKGDAVITGLQIDGQKWP